MIGDPFSVLGVSPQATLAEAEAAYKRLVELFHPDRLTGLREQVQAEGIKRMREATDAIHAVRSRFNRPLVAPGHERPHAESNGAMPVPADTINGGHNGFKPSDEATAKDASLYDLDLRSMDGPELHVRWSGRHAQATLAALRHGHRRDGAIRQVEWGTYSVSLEGPAVKRLLCSVLDDDGWRGDPAEVLKLGKGYSDWLPARPGDVTSNRVPLATVLDLLLDDHWYTVLADVY